MTIARLDSGMVCAIIVTFNPDPVFRSYLDKIRARFIFTFIVDNGSKGASTEMLRSLSASNVRLLEMGRNTGLGTALNHGVCVAGAKGYRWAVLFDQDTEPLEDMARYFSTILSEHPRPERVAVIGSRFHDRNRGPHAPTDPSQESDNRCSWRERRRVITSGSLISMDAYEAIGPFREDLFIDSIDHEYCYRARMKGWSVLQSSETLVSHSVGNYKKHRLLGIEIWRSHHSAVRCFFIARNRMLLARERGEYSKLLGGATDVIRNSLLVLLFEEDKLAKIRATISGYLSGVSMDSSIPEWIKKELD